LEKIEKQNNHKNKNRSI